jgi:hypothetical protein
LAVLGHPLFSQKRLRARAFFRVARANALARSGARALALFAILRSLRLAGNRLRARTLAGISPIGRELAKLTIIFARKALSA